MTSKIEATLLIQRFDLEGLPAHVINSKEREKLDGTLVESSRVTVRTGKAEETKNLPRLVNFPRAEAVQWARLQDPDLDLIIQPAALLEYSVEVLVSDVAIAWEAVPGFWELDSAYIPYSGLVRPVPAIGATRLSARLSSQEARFIDADGNKHTRAAKLSDSDVASVTDWIERNWARLQALRDAISVSQIGLKVGSYAGFGLSPQNLRSASGVDIIGGTLAEPSPDAPIIRTIEADLIVEAVEVVIAFGVRRENHTDLQTFAARLADAGVETAWVAGGLLSHFAIILRENGLRVRQLSRMVKWS